MKTLLTVALLSLLASTARAGEKSVPKSAVPKAALEAATKKYPKAKLLKFSKEVENNTTTFEVVLMEGERKIEVELSPEGKILAEEETIAFSQVPDSVTKALAAHAKYGKWTVKKAERVVKEEKTDAPSFEIVVTSGSKGVELVFDKDGKIVKEEEKAAKDRD